MFLYDKKSHRCFGCGKWGRHVDYHLTLNGYYHYQCFLDTGMHPFLRSEPPVQDESRPAADYDASGNTPIATTPDQLGLFE